jgi:hypothetical protein
MAMKEKKQPSAPNPASAATGGRLFGRDNYMWMIAGIVLVALGILLMSGGKSADPNVFKDNEVYSFRRITLAPIVILLGLGIEVYAIFKKPKA